MQKASLAGAVFLGIFALPFLGFGLFFATKMADSARTQSAPGAYLGVAFGAIFACIGLGLIAAAVAGYRSLKRKQEVMSANPTAPWMWRDDWAAGHANGKSSASNIGLWIFAIFWDAISFPAAVLTFPKLMAGDLRILLVMFFPLIGTILTAAAAVGTMRAQRFGKTSFWFASNPFVPGGRVSGSIHLRMPTTASHGIDVRLSCIRRVTTGSGKNRSTVDTILWQEERNIPGEQVARSDFESQVAVEFNIPQEAPETNGENADDKFLWMLHAQADVPGVDFKDDYELPVFRTQQQKAYAAASGEWVDSGAANRDPAAAARPADWQIPVSAPSDEPVTTPSHTHIVITEDGASTVVYFPPLRNPAQALGLFAFVCVWTGVVYMLFAHDAPWLFRIVFGGAEVLLGVALVNVIFGSTRIRVGEGSLSIRSAIMGIGWTKTVPLDGVESVKPVSQGQADSSGAAKFGVFVKLSDGRVLKVAASSLSRTEARWIVAALDRAMGRKQDTEVQFQPMTAALPVQWKGGVTRVGGVSSSKISRVIGIVFFAIWLSFVGQFIFRFGKGSSRKPSSPNPTATAKPVESVVAPMSDEEESRILALPTQEQAEELLERSIRHDERALRLLQERVDGWTSEIHLTDRMRRLEDQSRYSTDLRVRQANEDIELALDGWHKDQDAVDRLMERSKSDQKYKAAALYFLGMEAGRGVDTQRIFEYLRETALHDPDETTRLWAVEGLRFFQTEDALDALWESFTTDASFAVRNRAGCNISDCGVFTRQQRMRSVPKLIALVNEPSLNPQMRSWSYMGLRAITGASLPEDPVAWGKWYGEHGSETLQAIQSQPWYKVVGDQ